MHSWSHNSVRDKQSSSFSSSLLDEIYRSMDAGDDKPGEFELWEDKVSRRHSESGGGGGSEVEDEGISSLRRASLLKKWTDIKTNAKSLTIRTRPSSLPKSQRIDDGPFFDGSVQSSGHVFEPVGFCESSSQKPSCFGPFGSKPGKADVFSEKRQQMENNYCLSKIYTKNVVHGPLITSKTQALKIYANLKKSKQPISPGGRLTTFLNSLLSSRHLKKPKDLNERKIEGTSKSTHATCSSTSSITKSCLSKNPPKSREKFNNGLRRTVSFCPVSVIIDEDCRPCGKKIIYAKQDFMNVNAPTMMSKSQFNDDDEENDYNDMTSDTSSDLFELDHLSTLQECQDLPVYETTHFDTKCAIANGLIS